MMEGQALPPAPFFADPAFASWITTTFYCFCTSVNSSSSRLIALELFLTYLLFLKVHHRTHTLFNIIQNSNRFSQELNFLANFLTTNHIQLIFRIACSRYVKLILFFQPAMIAQTDKAVN